MSAHEEHRGHVVSVTTYVVVFLTLMLLTAATVWASGRDFGALNTAVALGIAITKATLVVLFFMHVKYASSLVKLYILAGIVWLGILLTITLSDYASRGWLGPAHSAAPYQLDDR